MSKREKIKEKLPFKVGKLKKGFSVWEQVLWDRWQEEKKWVKNKKLND